MSKVTGALLIMAGLCSAGYVLSTGPDLSPDLSQGALFQVTTDIAKSSPASSAGTVALAPMTAAERLNPPPSVPAPTAAPKPQPITSLAAPAPASKPAAPPPAAAAPPSQAWPPFVTLAQREGERARMPLPPPQRPSAFPADRASLARDLQRELRRVGCYEGEINATWTTSTRRAMKAFIDRVNATLPFEEPDSILLALVQSHQDTVCGKPCPAGQGLSEAGKCLPTAILARATKGSTRPTAGAAPKGHAPEAPAPAIVGWSTSTTVAAPLRAEPPGEGRMALAGPRTDDGSQATASPMPGTGVSVLPNPAGVPPAAFPDRRRGPRHEAKGAWARSFWKRRDSLF